MGAPQSDRNLIDFSLNAGLDVSEPFEHREDDVLGIGLGLRHVSSRREQTSIASRRARPQAAGRAKLHRSDLSI